MPIQPALLERLAFYRLNAAPAVILDLAGALAYQALSVAVELGVFPALETRPRTAAELAQVLDLETHGVAALLEALASTGYVAKRDSNYANTALTRKWLLDNEAFDTEALVAFWDEAVRELWAFAPEVLRTGERPYDFYEWVEATPKRYHSYQQTLVMTALNVGPQIARKIALPAGPTRLLDVGGGHGMFSVLLCERYPELHATVLDSPAALGEAAGHVAEHGLADRIRLQPGDLWQAPWDGEFDLILLFNLLHHFDLETNARLLAKAAGALKPGGQVAILDQVAGRIPGAAANAFIRLIALQYYLFADGRVFTRDELNGLLARSGFAGIQFHSLAQAPGTSLITARRAA